MKNNNESHRKHIRNIIEQQFNNSIEEKIDRYIEIEHQPIIGYHFFSDASSECIYTYRDGHYISTVMISHAINEGIIKFIADRNHISRKKENGNTKAIEELINELFNNKITSKNCMDAHLTIYKSFRADIHHMNPSIVKIPFKKCAKQNIVALSIIEKEIFGYDIKNRAISPHQPKYWDISKDNRTTIFIR